MVPWDETKKIGRNAPMDARRCDRAISEMEKSVVSEEAPDDAFSDSTASLADTEATWPGTYCCESSSEGPSDSELPEIPAPCGLRLVDPADSMVLNEPQNPKHFHRKNRHIPIWVEKIPPPRCRGIKFDLPAMADACYDELGVCG